MRLLKGIYISGIMLFSFYLTWILAQWLLGLLVPTPAWQQELAAYAILLAVIVGLVATVAAEGERYER